MDISAIPKPTAGRSGTRDRDSIPSPDLVVPHKDDGEEKVPKPDGEKPIKKANFIKIIHWIQELNNLLTSSQESSRGGNCVERIFESLQEEVESYLLLVSFLHNMDDKISQNQGLGKILPHINRI